MILLSLLLGVFMMAGALNGNQKTNSEVTLRHIGPGNGGAMFGIGIKPDDPNVILFGSDMGSLNRTTNGGLSWVPIGGSSGHQPGNTRVYSYAYDIQFSLLNPSLVWVAGNGAFKSTDAGKSWQRMTNFLTTLGAVAIDPIDNNIIYIAEGTVPRLMLNKEKEKTWDLIIKGRIWKSSDGGKSWRKLPRPGGRFDEDDWKSRNYSTLVIDSNSKFIAGAGHTVVYLAGRSGLFRSDDAGNTWHELGQQFAQGQICDLKLIKRHNKTTLILAVAPGVGLKYGGIYRSDDEGKSWQSCNSGLKKILDRVSLYNQELAKKRDCRIFSLILAHSPQKNSRLYVGSGVGIARSDDLGKHWQQLVPDASYVKDRHGKYIGVLKNEKIFKKSLWGGIDAFHRLVAAHNNADIVLFDDNQGLYLTRNGGKTWEDITFDYGAQFCNDALAQTGLPPNRYTHKTRSRGIQNLVCDQLAIDPFNPKIYYAAYMDLGLEISRDGGKFWEHPTQGLPTRGHAWAIVADPGKQGRLFVTIGQRWNPEGGIYRSNDSGKSWQRIGLENSSMGAINDIAIDIKSPVDSRIIYVTTAKNGVYKSNDGGNNWKSLPMPPIKSAIKCSFIKLNPENSQQLYVGSDAGLLISKDSGKSWQIIGKGQFSRVKNISICQNNPKYIYLTAYLENNNHYFGQAHLYRSKDNGQTFKDITPKYFKHAGAIAVNPYNHNYIYACNYLMRDPLVEKMWIIRSTDGGKSWENITNDISFCRGVRIAINPKKPRQLFIHARFSVIEAFDKNAPIK
jgi:photosystem II stability/assembly factor-like uncharacterized protein